MKPKTEMPLAAIWMHRQVQTETKKTARISKGHKIRVEGSVIKDVSDSSPATHEVVECRGTLSNSILYFILKDLSTGEKSSLDVK